MAWTTISNALVAVGAKPFATTIQALRDNLPAAFAGDAGAPRLAPTALGDGAFLGQYSGNDTTPVAITGLDAVDRISGMFFVSRSSTGTAGFRFSLSADGGATWTAWADIVTVDGTQQAIGEFHVGLSAGTWGAMGIRHAASADLSGPNFRSGTVSGGPFNAVRFTREVGSMTWAYLPWIKSGKAL